MFHASKIVTKHPYAPKYLVDLIQEQWDWFNANLKHPKRFTRTKRRDALSIRLSWFRPTATAHIHRARGLAALVGEHTFAIATVTTKAPGVVVYEDTVQIVAIPFRR